MNRTPVHEDDEIHDDLGLTESPRRRHRRTRSKGRLRGCLAVLVSLAVLAGIVGGALFGLGKGRDYLSERFGAPDFTGEGKGAVTVEIDKGQNSDDIADTLEEKGVVKSAKAFERAARDDTKSRSIQAGTYTLRLEMSAVAALKLLLDPKSSQVQKRVSVPSGKTLREATALIQGSKAAALPPRSVAAALAKPATLGLPAYARNRPEGFLYPGTYDLPKGATATSILRQMTAGFTKAATSAGLPGKAAAVGRTPYDVVVIASIIEAETNRKADYPKVARVIYNRLQTGMRLQMDSTVHYFAGRSGSVFTSPADRARAHPYNTYRNTGLPPGPINSPTADTLRAALNPAAGSWVYFTTVNLDTGETLFSTTVAERETNEAKLVAWCGQHKDHPGCA